MLNCARAENEISKNLFPWVASRGLYWENEMYKLKRSILNGNDGVNVDSHLAPAHLIFLTCTCVYIAFNSHVQTTTHTKAMIRRCLPLLVSRSPPAGLLKL